MATNLAVNTHMRQYLCEGIKGAFPFIVDKSATPVLESQPSGSRRWRLPGRLSICDCVNGNNRRYRKAVWEKNLVENSVLMQAIKRNAAFGLLEHPEDGKVTLLSPISHHVTRAVLVEAKDEKNQPIWEVQGEISIYDTEEGRKLKALIDDGYNPLVSSRGYGTLETGTDGVDDVKEDYVCEGWDTVIKPSFERAEVMANPVQQEESKRPAARVDVTVQTLTEGTPAITGTTASTVLTGTVTGTQKTTDLKESQPSTTGAALPAASKPKQKTTMSITEIKSRMAALKGIEPSKLTPRVFAESLADMEALHQEAAKYVAEDATRAYEGQRIHRELDAISENWNKVVSEPARRASKLQENTTKLMKVIAATAKTGITYKTKLGESVTQLRKSSKLNEELTRRGQGWRDLAESRKAKLTEVSEHFDTASEALDIMAERYHNDTTELGRQLIMVEFKDKITPEIEKKLKEANRLRHIAAIREELEGKKPEEEKNEDGEVQETKASPVVRATTGKAVQEDKKAPVLDGKSSAKPAEKVTEAKKPEDRKETPKVVVSESKVTLSQSARDPRDITESVAMVRRLSPAAPAK